MLSLLTTTTAPAWEGDAKKTDSNESSDSEEEDSLNCAK